MNTLLDVARPEKLSPACKALLHEVPEEIPIHALLRPAPRKDRTVERDGLDPVRPEPIEQAIRMASRTLGRDSKERLERRTRALRLEVPDSTLLWMADALAVELPARRLAELSGRPDVRRIDLQPRICPARRSGIRPGAVAETDRLELQLGFDSALVPKIGIVDRIPETWDAGVLADASFDAHGRPGPSPERGDELGETWQRALQNLIPTARRLRAGVFDETGSATFAQVVAGLQWTLEREADVVLLDLGAAAFHPLWHLPFLHCTLNGTAVVVAGASRGRNQELWPVHVPLAGCYDRGLLRSDLLVSGAPIAGVEGGPAIDGSLAAAVRTVTAAVLLQTLAPRLRRDPVKMAGLLFAGPRRGVDPRGEVRLDPESMLRALCSAA